jgi:hypothetical protein
VDVREMLEAANLTPITWFILPFKVPWLFILETEL